jgi:transcriptional regulator with XRE-family HTH domain
LIPKPYDFEPKFLGEHVRKRRLEKGQMQKEAATELGVNPWTVLNWEKGHTEPPIGTIPAILQYLGYDPFPEPLNLPEQLLAKRRQEGWSIKVAAKSVGVDPCTWGDWERGQMILYHQHRIRVASLLDLYANKLDREKATHRSQSDRCEV